MQRQLNFSLFWNITRFLLNDTNYVAWYPMIKAVKYITCVWEFQDSLTVKNKIREMFDRLLLNVGYNTFDKSDFAKCLIEEAVKWACVFGADTCRRTAVFQLKKHLESSVEDKFFQWREWIYCKGLMTADLLTWNKVWNKWKKTLDNTFLEYLTCSTNHVIIQSYLQLIITDGLSINATDSKRNATIFLLIVAKHAKHNTILEYIFSKFESLKFNSKMQVDQIAILIVIITYEHDVKQLEKISEFVEFNMTITENRIVDAVKRKIKKRKNEYKKRVTMHGIPPF